MVLQIHERGGVALLARKEMFVNPEHLGAGPPGEFTDTLLHKGLVPALHRGRANAVRTRELALRHTAVVGFKDFQPIGFSRPQPRQYAGKAMTEVPIAVRTMVFGYAQVQHHDLIALARMLEGAPVRGLDAHRLVLTVDAGRTLAGPRPDMDILVTLNMLYPQPGKD